MESPLVDEDCHTICQAIFQGVEGAYIFEELHNAVTCKKSGEKKKARALWTLKEAKDKGIDFYDLGSVQKVRTRSQVRLDYWAIHLKSPTAALADALRRTRDGAGRAQSSVAGGSERRATFDTERVFELGCFSVWCTSVRLFFFFFQKKFTVCCVCCSLCVFSHQGWAAPVWRGL